MMTSQQKGGAIQRRMGPTTRKGGRWLAVILLLAGTTTVASLSWLSVQVLINPDVAFLLDQFLPGSSATGPNQEQPSTLSRILKVIRRSGQVPGRPLVLATNPQRTTPLLATADVLVPILSQDCPPQTDPCQHLTELRVYRSLELPYLLRIFQGKRHYRLLDRMEIEGLTQAQFTPIFSSLVANPVNPLPFTQVKRYYPAPKPGVWLRLTGFRTEGNTTIAYGRILYFHQDDARLSLMLNWASPTGEFPVWQQVTGGGEPELVLNQSVGLEPQFSIYQLQFPTSSARRVQEISLADPVFSDATYNNSLMLARSGLWSPAFTLLSRVKQQNPQRWSPAAQAQLDFIQLHAQITQAQAQQTSASATQRMLAYLINGSWTAATQVLQANGSSREEVRQILQTDSGGLWARIKAALAVNPDQPDAIAWGAMVLSQQKGATPAINWTRQRTSNDNTLKYVQTLLRFLDQPTQSSIPLVQASTSPTASPNKATDKSRSRFPTETEATQQSPSLDASDLDEAVPPDAQSPGTQPNATTEEQTSSQSLTSNP